MIDGKSLDWLEILKDPWLQVVEYPDYVGGGGSGLYHYVYSDELIEVTCRWNALNRQLNDEAS